MTGIGSIVMAAGLGKRMRSKVGKVLHPVAGKPMVLYAVELAQRIVSEEVVVVVGHQGDQVKAVLDRYQAQHRPPEASGPTARRQGMTARVANEATAKPPLLVAEQQQQLGTGHAVMQARDAVLRARGHGAETYLILNGDTPLLSEETIRRLLVTHRQERATLTLLTAMLEDATGYGRVIRRAGSGSQPVTKIVEDKDATRDEAAVKEINVGTYVVDGAFLFKALDRLRPQNAQQEYYLTDLVGMAAMDGLTVSAVVAPSAAEGLGVNSREQLAAAERIIRDRIRRRWMEDGVTLIDPPTTWIDADVMIGQDTVLYPHVTLEGRTAVGEACVIRSHSRLTSCRLGDRVVVLDSCVVTDSIVEDEGTLGPFAHLRPGSVVRRHAKVGNFVEMKKTDLGEGSKANHLTYLGDARVGKGVNIGAGTITCNYDGHHKYETVIQDEVFIGSDSQLVAPVTVGRGAVIGAGATITQDVPPDALALSRVPQVNREGWAAKRRAWLAGEASRSSGTPNVPSTPRAAGTGTRGAVKSGKRGGSSKRGGK